MYEHIDYYRTITELLREKLLRDAKPCCKKQYLGLFLRNSILKDKENGRYLLEKGLYKASEYLEFITDENFHLMKAIPLFKELYDIDASIKIDSYSKTTNRLLYRVKIRNYTPFVGKRLMILDDSFRFMYGLSISLLYSLGECDIREMIGATLLFSSSLYIKNNGFCGKNLRIYTSSTNFALSISRIFKKMGITSIFSKTKNSLTLVNDESIEKLLTFVGCRDFAEQFKVSNLELMGQKDKNANTIRSNRASENAVKNIEKALAMQRKYNYPVSEKLLDAVKLRLKYKTATLSQLGTRANPPLSKDAIASRIRRFIHIMEEVSERYGEVSPEKTGKVNNEICRVV